MRPRKWFVACIIALCSGGLVASERSVVLTSMNYPPFNGNMLENYGPLIELVTEAYRKEGYVAKVIFAPWARAIKDARKEVVADGMVGVWHSKDRAKDFLYSAALFPSKMGFYKRKSQDIKYMKHADLKKQGYILGSVIGYILPKGLEESGIKISRVADDIQNLKKLALKRIDLVAVDKNYGRYVLNGLPEYAKEIEWMDPVLEVKQMHLIISRHAIDFQEKINCFNKGLKQLRQTGEAEKILAKHGLR